MYIARHQSARRARFVILCCLFRATIVFGQMPMPLNLMPIPAEIQQGTGSLRIDAEFSVAMTGYTEPRLDRAVERFHVQLARETGIPITGTLTSSKPANESNPGKHGPSLVIRTDHASKAVQQLGEDESYALDVTPTQATLTAPTPLGAMHGLQTLLQLVTVSPDGFVIPAVHIRDSPRFAWRGLMIDVSRHFIPLDVLKRNLDGMEQVKMNVFHWHLSDNQGFRVESKRFPKLQQMGSDGLFYTQAEVRDLIDYARDRGIRVIPEFDMPGHCTAWFVGYPELASGPGPYQIERRWGVFNPAIDPTNEKTYKFLDKFIAEMTRLFPDDFFHVGGDEVNGKQWDANQQIQAFMHAHDIHDNKTLQAYFNTRLQAIVAKHKKTMIGWDEVLDPKLSKEITIQSWRGTDSLFQAAKEGYRGLLSNGWYLDLGWSAARHYAVDPLGENAGTLSSEEKARILGGEACMWVEFVDPENIDSRIWPRNAAIAERLWSPQGVRDPDSMYSRLAVISQQLEWLGLTHRASLVQMRDRIAGSATHEEADALRVLASVVEPVKDYKREETATVEATSNTPLNRLIDAIPPESDLGRRFGEAVDKYLQSRCQGGESSKESLNWLRAQLEVWQHNDANFAPLAQRSFLAKEAAGRSQDLSAIAGIGLASLDYLAKGTSAPADWKSQQSTILQNAGKPKAQLLLIPVPAIARLVEAATSSSPCGSN